jgi:hypothetical protein
LRRLVDLRVNLVLGGDEVACRLQASREEVAKTSGNVKKSMSVPKPSSPRDSQPDDLDTVLVVSSEEISKARAEAESLTSETATIDCHPVILDDSEESTDRFVGNDASRSGLVTKDALKADPKAAEKGASDVEPETTTVSIPQPMRTLLDGDDEIMEISASGIEPDDETTQEGRLPSAAVLKAPRRAPAPVARPVAKPVAKAAAPAPSAPSPSAPSAPKAAASTSGKAIAKAEPPPGKEEPRATITEVREVEPLPGPRPSYTEETTTKEERKKARFDDETMPMLKPDLVDIAGAMETVPLNSALVANVLAQVDARAAARAAGQPVPHFQVPTGPAHAVMGAPPATPQQAHPAHQTHTAAMVGAPVAPQHVAPLQPAAPPRRLGVEIMITVAAFLFVAVPALYYLYASFAAQ